MAGCILQLTTDKGWMQVTAASLSGNLHLWKHASVPPPIAPVSIWQTTPISISL